MEKTILYPFSIGQDNAESYTRTLKLAEQLDAKVVCFTTVTETANLDSAYLHLLSLNGYYQTTTNNWIPSKVLIEKVVGVGEMSKNLEQYLKEEKVDVLIGQSDLETWEEGTKEWMLVKDNWSKVHQF